MNKRTKVIVNLSAVAVIVAIMVIGKITGAQANTFWSLIPPLVAIGLALITKETYSSLFVGIVAGAILASNFSFTGAADTTVNSIICAVQDTSGIFVFLVVLGTIVALLNKVGGSKAFGIWAEKNVKSRVGAMFATFILGVLIFVDDYFNCLTVGSVMKPIADQKNISRAKLAYLIDATAAPICMIAPVSSWAAAVSSYTSGTDYSGIELFVRAIPYNFYSILTLVFVIGIIAMKFDYGPMRIHEANAILRGDLYTTGEKNEERNVDISTKGRVIDLVIPVVILIVACIGGLLYSGYQNGGRGIIGQFSDTDATFGLPWGGLLALIIIIAYLMVRKLISFKEAMECVPQGFIAMVPAILILTFATALKSITNSMGVDVFVNKIVGDSASGFAVFLPAIIFIIACFLAFATGTSWGTFAILIPIVISIFEPGSNLMIVGMSACLAGAVCGDHCSPISDTTIMSSAGGQCNHINHVSTQLPYAVSVAVISFLLYVIIGIMELAGLDKLIWITIPLGVVMTIGFLVAMKAIIKKKYGNIYN